MRFRALPFLATATLLASPARQAPHASWRTIRTAHYRIHYPLVLSDWAQDVASRVEGTALWNTGERRGPFQRAAGIEWRLMETLAPGLERHTRKLDFAIGVHHILDGSLKKHDVVTTSFLWRP